MPDGLKRGGLVMFGPRNMNSSNPARDGTHSRIPCRTGLDTLSLSVLVQPEAQPG